MNDRRTYRIRLEGWVDEGEINATSPVRVTVARAGEAGTVLGVCTDQSGLVGLIRHLHGLGFVLLSLWCASDDSPSTHHGPDRLACSRHNLSGLAPDGSEES